VAIVDDKNQQVTEDSNLIEKKIEEALNEIDLIHEKKILVKTGEELEALERRIIEATDRLAGALVAQKIQDSVKNSELKKEALRLTKSYPKAMKNQGLRDVIIRPSRGEPFTVKSSYFSRKGKRKKKVE
jgi:BMFP domain-containing protein YqiC